jgi:hypothetical protein
VILVLIIEYDFFVEKGTGPQMLLILLLLLGADASFKKPQGSVDSQGTTVKLHTAILRDIPHQLTELDFLF